MELALTAGWWIQYCIYWTKVTCLCNYYILFYHPSYKRAAVCRHVKAVEKENMSREHGMDSVMETIIINADDDDDDNNDDTSEYS